MPPWDECGLAASWSSVTRSSLAFVVHRTSCMPWVQLQVHSMTGRGKSPAPDACIMQQLLYLFSREGYQHYQRYQQ